MIIELGKVVSCYEVLKKIGEDNENLPFKISYWCMKNLKGIEDDVKFYYEERNKLVDIYLEKDDKGEFVTEEKSNGFIVGKVKENYIEEFTNKMLELENTEIKINPYTIEANYLFENDSFNMSVNNLYHIDFLIKD